MVIRIGTRKSKLAMIQTELVKEKLEAADGDLDVEIVPMSTKGDEILDRSLTGFGGKGVFTKELEEALLHGEIDMAVHSAKDMPMEFPRGLGIGAVLARSDARDVLVTMHGCPAGELAPGSVVGTSSLRRELQIKHLNPGLCIKLLRGNVQTRLDKLERGEYDGILLAAAGLERLDLYRNTRYHYEYLAPRYFVPAAGQGLLAVEIRQGEFKTLMRSIHDAGAGMMLAAERRFLSVLGGGCNAPCAAYSQIIDGRMKMRVMYAGEDSSLSYQEAETAAPAREEEAAALGERLAKRVRIRPVYLVGAGPGDAGLISRKGLSCVRKAGVLVYDSLVSPSFLNEAPLEAELIYAGKRASHHHLKQEEINRLLVEKALEGRQVVRLKGGDPFVFGRGGEEAGALREAGIPFEIVPGISSSYAVPAYAGIPVTHREAASSFHVITGHEGKHKERPVLDYDTLAREEGTLVFLMGLGNLEGIAAALIEHGKKRTTPAAVIQQGTSARQRCITGTLETIARDAVQAGLGTPAITVIGPVAGLRERLSWFGNGPLSGKKILLTGTRPMTEKLHRLLAPHGAETVDFSLIYTRPLTRGLEETAGRLREYTWLVFTSGNGVDIFFDYLKARHWDLRQLAHVRFTVIGEGTKDALEQRGFTSDFVPGVYTSEALAGEWIPSLGKEDRVALLRAREASAVLPRELERAGIAYDDAALYETAEDMRRAEELNRILPDMDYITFASASAVNAFAKMAEDVSGLEGKVVCIGPVTRKAALDAGLCVYAGAASYTAEGIRDIILLDNIKDEE